MSVNKIFLTLFSLGIFLFTFGINLHAEDANDISVMHQVSDPIDGVSFIGVNSDDPRMISFVALQNETKQYTSAQLFYSLPNPASNQVETNGDRLASLENATTIQWLNYSSNDGIAFVAELDTNKGTSDSIYIPVGSIFEYYWEFIDSKNNLVRTEKYSFVFLDGQFQWNQIDEFSNLNLYYYGAKDQSIINASFAAEDVINEAIILLDIELNFPIRIIYYRAPNDALLAVPPGSKKFSEGTVVEGTRYRTDVVHRYAGDDSVIRHEITHIMTKIAGEGSFTKLPFWVDEGLATFLMNDDSYDRIIASMIKSDAVFRLSSIQGKPGTPEKVNAFYAQSYSVTKYLIEEYGEEKYKNFFQKLKADNSLDDALLQTYNYDQDSLYLAWRYFHKMPEIILEKLDSNSNLTSSPVIKPLSTPRSLQANDTAASTNQSINNQKVIEENNNSFYNNPKNIIILFAGIIFMLVMSKIIKKLWQE